MITQSFSPRFARFALGIVGFSALGLLAGVLAPPEHRTGILLGAGASGFSGLCAFVAVHIGLSFGTMGLFGGISAGFLLRMLVLAFAVIGSGLRGPDALVLAFAFFLVYAGTQAIEIAYVARAPKHSPHGGTPA